MKKVLKPLSIGVVACLAIFLIYIYCIRTPSNSRDWEFGMETLPHFDISGTSVSVTNARDNEFIKNEEFKLNLYNKTYDAQNISKVWFVVSKFSGFGGIAHTYFVFDMKDSEPVTVSVEARREKGEDYSIPGGLFNKFELIYIWATERDSIVRRTLINKDKVYMYPLEISDASAQRLFLQLAKRSQALEYTPRFYNTLTSNCTNELAKSANEIKPGTIPMNLSLVLPGYSASELHKLGYIKGKGSIEEIESRHYITDFVSNHYMDSNLTEEIREFLSGN